MRVEQLLSGLVAAAGPVARALLDGFRATARTLGLSPKALAGPIGAALTGLLALVGLSPEVIGGWLGVAPVVVVGGISALAALVAAWLLPPGRIDPASVTRDTP